MHHLLLADDSDTCLLDILRLDSLASGRIPLVPPAAVPQTARINDELSAASPLHEIVPQLRHLPKLSAQITTSITNNWNEFVQKYGNALPPEAEDAGLTVSQKPISGLVQLISIVIITAVIVARDFCRGFNATKHYPLAKVQFLAGIMCREVNKRQLSWPRVNAIVRQAAHPSSLLRSVMAAGVGAFRFCFWRMPKAMLAEASACVAYFFGSGKSRIILLKKSK